MRQGYMSGIVFVFCIVVIGAGCAAVSEAGRGIAGVSTKVLEDNRNNAVRKSYPVDYAACRETVNGVLADAEVYIYARNEDKKMIAFYLSESDTTPVGVFFTRQTDVSTEVAVSSPSRYAKELIADKIAARFDKMLRSVQEPVVAATPVAVVDQGKK